MLGSVYLPPQSSSYSNEDTWKLLSEEMAALLLKYPRMGFILMGDYNVYTTDFLEQRDTYDGFHFADPSIQKEESFEKIRGRHTKDKGRRKKTWGSKLLNFVGSMV